MSHPCHKSSTPHPLSTLCPSHSPSNTSLPLPEVLFVFVSCCVVQVRGMYPTSTSEHPGLPFPSKGDFAVSKAFGCNPNLLLCVHSFLILHTSSACLKTNTIAGTHWGGIVHGDRYRISLPTAVYPPCFPPPGCLLPPPPSPHPRPVVDYEEYKNWSRHAVWQESG